MREEVLFTLDTPYRQPLSVKGWRFGNPERKSLAVVGALRGNGIFAGIVFEAAETVEFDSESHALPVFRESFDPETARFYIPEAVKYRAEVRFERKGSHIMALVLGAILFALLLVVLILSKDRILGLISDFFNALAA